jgi:hypothetical protein
MVNLLPTTIEEVGRRGMVDRAGGVAELEDSATKEKR